MANELPAVSGQTKVVPVVETIVSESQNPVSIQTKMRQTLSMGIRSYKQDFEDR